MIRPTIDIAFTECAPYRGQLAEVPREPRRPLSALAERRRAPRREALELYPEYRSDILALKRVGVESAHGFFNVDAWEDTCGNIGLYMLPMFGKARGALGEIRNAIGRRRARLSTLGKIMERPKDTAILILNEMSRRGELLPSVFPDFREVRDNWHDVDFDYPAPPRDVAEIAQKVRLAGYLPYVAVPGRAVRLNRLEDIVDTEPQRSPDHVDPIVYAKKDRTAVVLTHYGDIDPGPMADLVRVLSGMDVQL